MDRFCLEAIAISNKKLLGAPSILTSNKKLLYRLVHDSSDFVDVNSGRPTGWSNLASIQSKCDLSGRHPAEC